ncbi:hypothethical protein [Staphylococcus caprae]|uniref:Hypothethical protein n=1 Tax=Staphylococcus caprae TaxID=29380 RepID=A0ABN5W6C0_9STAP|nr:hypothethical protein [Staphylococcus caprae]BBD93615.1 hypothethical protein [Staphylococcus caprae]BBD96091.1 hypothetical protein JMUB898_2543 [Staphylococcus caprae]
MIVPVFLLLSAVRNILILFITKKEEVELTSYLSTSSYLISKLI